jgi:hypothetical protein
MKHISFSSLTAFIVIIVLTVFSACDKGKLPNIAFKTGGTYLSADKTVAKGDTVLVGIKASKAETSDILKTFNESVFYDGSGAATSLDDETLSGSQNDSYDKDFKVVARKQAGTEKYTFTVVNRDGLTNSVSLTLTVQ